MKPRLRTVILGLDAFDPQVFERLHDGGRLPNLAKYVERGGYSRLRITNPAQSEVSWTSIATGVHPDDHGIFDFVHRDPGNYSLYVSLLPTKKSLQGVVFARPHSAHTLFAEAVERGYPATSLWWPATFPAQPASPVRTIPGLGTPDIRGRLGVGTFYSAEGDRHDVDKTPVEKLQPTSRGRFEGQFMGPEVRGKGSVELGFELYTDGAGGASLVVGGQSFVLVEGAWSPIIELRFRLGLGLSADAITRVILMRGGSDPELYCLPLQIHPLKPLWSYGTPPGFVKETWKACGPYLTIGWPQDTTALEEGLISDEQFLALCDSIFEHRKWAFLYHLERFSEGVLGAVFDSLDRVQHMFWRDRPDIVEAWYTKLDRLVGLVDDSLAKAQDSRLLVLSDHGFEDFHHKVHLNRWLMDQGYLAGADDHERGVFGEIDWSETKAYAVGLNSLYLNLRDRERDGIVGLAEVSELKRELIDRLGSWRGAGGGQVVAEVYDRQQDIPGMTTSYGPDMLVGYSPGYRASAETGLGGWRESSLEPNHDHWGADHCFAPASVPGVIFSNGSLSDLSKPSYLDIPELAGVSISARRPAAPVPVGAQEDMAEVEERLRSLGYL